MSNVELIYSLYCYCNKEVSRYKELKASMTPEYWGPYKKKIHYNIKILDILEQVESLRDSYTLILKYLSRNHKDYDTYIELLEGIANYLDITLNKTFNIGSVFKEVSNE